LLLRYDIYSILESCGEVPEIENGVITYSDNSSFFGSQANVTCDHGFTADKSNITCLSSGNWDNVTCIRTGICIYTTLLIVNNEIMLHNIIIIICFKLTLETMFMNHNNNCTFL
jgi:hypothetical protein